MAFPDLNNLTSITAEYWALALQEEYMKRLTGQHVSRMTLESKLSDGDTFNKSYLDASNDELDVYTPGTDLTVETVTPTNEQLLINKKYGNAREWDDFETVQAAFSIADEMAPKDAQRIANRMDVDILGEISNANSTLDNGVLSGSSSDGVGIDVTVSNVVQIFSHVTRLFEENDVQDPNKKAIISPKFADVLQQYTAGRDTALGDQRLLDGSMGRFMGYDIYVSNQVLSSATLSIATTPTDGDTVVFDGITMTFKNTLGSTAGNVAIAGSADAARVNLGELIAAPGTTDAGQVAFATTSSSYKKLTNRVVSVTDDASADTMVVVYKGRSALAVSETLTDATDAWTANKTLASCTFCAGTPTDVVTQDVPSVEITRADLRFSNYVKRGLLYGLKTFREGTFRQVKVDVLA